MTRRVMCVCSLAAILLFSLAQAELWEEQQNFAKALGNISGERMLADVTKLSSPEFNGRQTGTEDDFKSARYIFDRFTSMHIAPAFPCLNDCSGLNPNGMTRPVRTSRLADNPKLQLETAGRHMSLTVGREYLPILDSPSVSVSAPVVFVGYGISDPAHGFDEYAGLNVRNQVVLFLRGKPDGYHAPIVHADKERMAREKGAVAYLTATGPILNAYEARRGITGQPSAFYSLSDGAPSLPGAWISTDVAEMILSGHEAEKRNRLRDRQQEINTLKPQSAETVVAVRMEWKSRQETGTLYNILAMIPGADMTPEHKTILLGAHRDHFGRQAGLLFAGADDNASGTAVLLEVARALTQSAPLRVKHSILLASFSGEEQGLLGSRLYVDQPVVPLNLTKVMINVDHAGVGNGRLTVGVTGLDKETAAEAGRTAGLADKVDLFGFFPGGDHVPFKEAGVPTLTVVSGGSHPHFHQPTDLPETIQPEVLATTARYVLAIVWQLANVQ
ncbi:MAG: M28 family peptidase [Nitrospiraceae bacterium]